jgi:hypothetical protein
MNLIRSPQTQEGGTSQCRVHRGECSYVYEYLYLYYASKKVNGLMNLIRSTQTWEGGTSSVCTMFLNKKTVQ